MSVGRIRIAVHPAALMLLAALVWTACVAGPQRAAGPERSAAAPVDPALPAALAAHPSAAAIPPLHFDPPQPEIFVLDNGMKVYLLEDHALPLVSLRFLVRTGSIYDPADKIGLANITGAVMRTGGTEEMTGDAIDDELEFLAASVETSIGEEMGSASVNVLKKDLGRALEILAAILRRPAFDPEMLDLQKTKSLNAILRRNDDPQNIASREFPRLVYGPDSVWGRIPEIETIEAIQREDLIAFHARYFAPNNMIASVAGDITRAEIEAEFARVFAGWEPRDVAFETLDPLPRRAPGSVNLIDDDVEQTSIRFGNFGMKRHDPDLFAVRVLNSIFGTGGFNARLKEEVRSNRGLAYSVWGFVGIGTERGIMEVGCMTKAESTAEAIAVSLDIMRDMVASPPTDEEMTRAKETMANQYVFQFDSAAKIVNERAYLDYLGYPEDYFDTYLDQLMAVTGEDVHNAARNYFHPDHVVILAVGKADLIAGDLAQFGEVNRIELAEPAAVR